MKVRVMNSERARTQWRAILDLASSSDVDVVIERHGKAIVAVINYDDYQAVRSVLAELRAGRPMQQRGEQMAAILERLATLPERAVINDPVSWQIEQRRERVLPGRDAA